MPKYTIASPGYASDAGYAPIIKKAVGVTSVGTRVFLVSSANVNGRGGDNTGIQRIYILANTDASAGTFTTVMSQLYAVGASTTVGDIAVASMVIDSANNIHVVYSYLDSTTSQSLRYRKLTNTGAATWTVGSEVIIKTAVTNRVYFCVDIDIASDTTMPIVAAAIRDGASGAYNSRLMVEYRLGSGTWVEPAGGYLRTHPGGWNYSDCSIAIRTTNDASTQIPCMVTWGKGVPTTGGTDVGDYVYMFKVNVNTSINPYVGLRVEINRSLNGGWRQYHVFYLPVATGSYKDRFIIHGQLQSSPSKEYLAVFNYAPGPTDTYNVLVNDRIIDVPTAAYGRYSRKVNSAQLVKSATNTNEVQLAVYNVTSTNVWMMTHEYDIASNLLTSTKNFRAISTGTTITATPGAPYSGDQGRFPSYSYIRSLTPHAKNSSTTIVQKWYYWAKPLASTTEISTPLSNAEVPTARPDYVIKVTGNGADSSAIRARLEVQVATDAGFASVVSSFAELHSAETYFATTPTSKTVSGATSVALLQATPLYYARARIVDQFNVAGPWSPARTFKIKHQPAAINTSPPSNGILIDTIDGEKFSWKFTDAYPLDVQSAYKLEVYDSLGALALDTGKVAGATSQVTVSVPSGLIDTNLSWRVFVYDAEDVQSPSVYQTDVLFTTPPAPAITYPAVDNDSVSTGSPTFSWTPGLGGTKTQISWRLFVQRYVDNVIVWDSGIQANSNTSVILPPSYLRNNVQYRVTLTVTDSTSLSTTTERLFFASWTAPAVRPAPTVYTERYNTDGYTSVEVSTASPDASIISWQLYRRALETSFDWVLVDSRATTDSYYTVRDYLCPAGVTVEYAVTQQADRFGDVVESPLSTTTRTQVHMNNSEYWLIDTDDPTSSLLIPTVTGESYQQDVEETAYTVVNRGRVVEVGEDSGVSGSLTCQIRNREKGWFNHENYNLLPNSNFKFGADSSVANWLLYDTGAQLGNPSVFELDRSSGPGNREKRMVLSVTKPVASTNQINSGFTCNLSASTYMRFTAGLKYFMSVWVQIPASFTGGFLNMSIDWKNGSTVSSTEVATISTNFPDISSAMYLETRTVGGDLWYRIGKVVTVPSGVDNLTVNIFVNTLGTYTAVAPVQFAFEGATLTVGSDPVQYFNGDTLGCAWVQTENLDPAFNPGYLSARSIRQSLESAKKSGHRLWIRNPFGDIRKVHVSGLSVSRVAGVGDAEFVDVEIPYLEVAI